MQWLLLLFLCESSYFEQVEPANYSSRSMNLETSKMADGLCWRTEFSSVGSMASLNWTSCVQAVTWPDDRSCLSFGHAPARRLESQWYLTQRLGRQPRAPIVLDARIRITWSLRSPWLGSLARTADQARSVWRNRCK